MKFNNLLATLVTLFALVQLSLGQSLKPGTVTFKEVYGSASSQNINTGAVEDITVESLLTEGFIIHTQNDSYLDIEFSNGVVGRLSPNAKLTIETFATSGGRSSRDRELKLASTRNRSTSTTPNLRLLLECGDLVINSTEKQDGELVVHTPTTYVDSDMAEFFLSHGTTNSEVQEVSKVINLSSQPITVRSTVTEAFNAYGSSVAYANFEQYSDEKSTSLADEDTVVVLSDKPEQTTAAQTYNDPYTSTADPYQQSLPDCDKARYSLVPIDQCMIDRLGMVSNHILNGGVDPMGFVVVTQADANSTYFNVVSGETGSLTPGMTLSEGSIIRTSAEGTVTTVFPNGAIMDVDPSSNVYVESIASHPVFSRGDIDRQTNISVRVESGMLTANTMNISTMDSFKVISPLDRHVVMSDSIVSVSFAQKDTNLFETISQNRTAGEATSFNTVVVTDAPQTSSVGGNFTFVEYSAEGETLAFATPPNYGHITESAVIPPEYDFIDRTIVFAAGATPGPTPVGTPTNPGDDFRINEEPPTP